MMFAYPVLKADQFHHLVPVIATGPMLSSLVLLSFPNVLFFLSFEWLASWLSNYTAGYTVNFESGLFKFVVFLTWMKSTYRSDERVKGLTVNRQMVKISDPPPLRPFILSVIKLIYPRVSFSGLISMSVTIDSPHFSESTIPHLAHRRPKLSLWGVILLTKMFMRTLAGKHENRDIVTAVIYYYITTLRRTWLWPFNSACGGVMLQRFEFTKVCMGENV